MKEAIVYIDGYNLYHHILNFNQNHYKWLDIRKLLKYYINEDEYNINKIKYFTAPTWKTDSSKVRQNRYIKALKKSNIDVIYGYFQKEKVCDHCPKISHKEKQTDVNISISMVKDVYDEDYDLCVLVSADQDLLPAFDLIKDKYPDKEIKVIRPQNHNRPIDPKRSIKGLIQSNISGDSIRDSLYPVKVDNVKRPKEYLPPINPNQLKKEFKKNM